MPRSSRKLISTPFGWVEYTKRKIGCQEKYFICGYYIYGNNGSSLFRLAKRVSSGLFSLARMFALPEGTWFRRVTWVAQQALQAGKGFVREFMRDRNYALSDSAFGTRKPQLETCTFYALA